MGDRFHNTSNDSDSKIDECIYKKNGILLYGSSKRESNRTPYKLSQWWKMVWKKTQEGLEFRTRSVNRSNISERKLLLSTLLRVKSDDPRLAPLLKPIMIEGIAAGGNEENWDMKWGAFVWK